MKSTPVLENPRPPIDFKRPAGIEDLLLFRLSKVVSLGGGIVTRICEGQFGVTRREWTVLAIVARADSMSWSEAAQRCEIDDARLSRAVSSLVAKKLLRKSHTPERQVVLALTPDGRQLYDTMFPLARQINMHMLEALDERLVDALSEALDRLHARGEEIARDTPVPKARRSRGGRREL